MSSQNDLYSTPEARANTAFDPDADLYRLHKFLLKSKNYWSTEVYTEPSPLNEYNEKFYAWLNDEYGIELQFNQGGNGMIGINGYTIVDEQKFLMFTLKFQ